MDLEVESERDVRFRRLDEVQLDDLRRAISRASVEDYIGLYECLWYMDGNWQARSRARAIDRAYYRRDLRD